MLACFFSMHLHADVPLDRIIAIVNDDVIMLSEMDSKLRQVRAQMSEAGNQLPPTNILEKQVLDKLVISKLQMQMAERNGIRISDEILNRAVNDIANANNVTLPEFREILESDGYSFEKFREDIRKEITINQLRQRNVINRIDISDREIENFLANEEFRGETEEEFRLGHILISIPEGSDDTMKDQVRQVAEQVLRDLQNGESFTDMAKTVSDGQQASLGGDLGWRKRNQIPTLFTDYIDDIRSGNVSEIIESPSGFHIIKLLEQRSGEKSIITQTKARHILVKTNELMSDEEAREKLEQLRYRIDQGDDFAVLAKANSDDTMSALEGGELGWRNPGELVPEFEDEMNSLEEGEISEPFQSPFGWHLVQVLERRDYDNSDNARKSRARDIIRKRKIEEAQLNWINNLRDDAYVQYRLDEY